MYYIYYYILYLKNYINYGNGIKKQASKNSNPKFMPWSFKFNFHSMGLLTFSSIKNIFTQLQKKIYIYWRKK